MASLSTIKLTATSQCIYGAPIPTIYFPTNCGSNTKAYNVNWYFIIKQAYKAYFYFDGIGNERATCFDGSLVYSGNVAGNTSYVSTLDLPTTLDALMGTTLYNKGEGTGTAYSISSDYITLKSTNLIQTTGGTISVRSPSVAFTYGGTSYYDADTISITASAASGYTFSSWSDGSTSATRTIDTETSISAVFKKTFKVKFDAGGGTGSIANESFVCGVSKKLTKNNGAITREGYAFTGWEDPQGNFYENGADGSGILDAVGGSAGDTITLTAQWTYILFDITVSKGNTASGATLPSGVGKLSLLDANGSVLATESSDVLSYTGDAGVQYTIVCEMPETSPSLLYTANGIYNNTTSSYETTVNFTPSAGTSLSKVYKFTAKALYSVNTEIHVYDKDNQEITPTPSGFSASVTSPAEPDSSEKYLGGRAITITGVPAAGYAMTKAIVNGTDYNDIRDNAFTIPTLNADVTASCHFTKIVYLLQAKIDTASSAAFTSVSVENAQSVQATYGDTVSFVAVLKSSINYHFYAFQDYDNEKRYAGTGSSRTYTYVHTVTGNATLYAQAAAPVTFVISARDNRSSKTPAADASTCSVSPTSLDVLLGRTISYTLTLGKIYEGASTNWLFNAWFSGTSRTNPLQLAASGTYTPTQKISLQADITTAIIQNTLTVRLVNMDTTTSSQTDYLIVADAISMFPTADSSSYDSSTGIYTFVFNGTKNSQLRAVAEVSVSETKYGFVKFVRSDKTSHEYSEWDLIINGTYTILAYYCTTGVRSINLAYCDGGNSTFGTFAITDTDDSEGEIAEDGHSATINRGKHITIAVTAKNGYKFGGWYTNASVSGTPYLTGTNEVMEVITSINLYAYFVADANAVYVWEGSGTNKCIEWRSKTYTAAKPFNPSCCRVDARGYNVGIDDTLELEIDMFSSPNATGTANSIVSNIESQNARRLPVRRAERYMQVVIRNNYEVDAVFVGTNMTEMAQ